MKAEFHKDLQNWRGFLYFSCLLLLLFLSVMSSVKTLYFLGIIYISNFIIFIASYKITDDDVLTENGKIPISEIRKLVVQPDGWLGDHYHIDLYYKPQNEEKLKIKQYYPKDKDLFVSTLKEINPKIEVI